MINQIAIKPINLRCDSRRKIASVRLESGHRLAQLIDPFLKGSTLQSLLFVDGPKVPETGQMLDATTNSTAYELENGTIHYRPDGCSFSSKAEQHSARACVHADRTKSVEKFSMIFFC